MKLGRWIVKWTICLIVLSLMVYFVLADVARPTPPNDGMTTDSQSRRLYSESQKLVAEAGNVSEIKINVSTITNSWQGYYGNITGTIVLDDALNNSMYTWTLADPEGEIFASRDSSIDWSAGNIVCANSTVITTEESTLNFNQRFGQDVDGVSETFSLTTHPQFFVANNTFAANACGFVVSTYVDDTADPNRAFNETILYSKSDDSTIYTALLYQGGSNGFKVGSADYDFQMLVAEDGHDGNPDPVDYYFWVELE